MPFATGASFAYSGGSGSIHRHGSSGITVLATPAALESARTAHVSRATSVVSTLWKLLPSRLTSLVFARSTATRSREKKFHSMRAFRLRVSRCLG